MLKSKYYTRGLLLILSCLLSATLTGIASTNNSANDIEKVLKEAQLKRTQNLKKRFNPIIQDLSLLSQQGNSAFYLEAIFKVFFSHEDKPEKSFKEWQKKNKSLVEDARLPVATVLAAKNLQGHLHLILQEEEQAVACFKSVIQGIANGPNNLTGFHLFQESLPDSLLVKFFGIDQEYFESNTHYLGAISNVEKIFTIHLLPWLETHQKTELNKTWDIALKAAEKVALRDETKAKKFYLNELPRLMTLKAESLAQTGLKKDALETLKKILADYPEYPKFEDIVETYRKLSAE